MSEERKDWIIEPSRMHITDDIEVHRDAVIEDGFFTTKLRKEGPFNALRIKTVNGSHNLYIDGILAAEGNEQICSKFWRGITGMKITSEQYGRILKRRLSGEEYSDVMNADPPMF